MTIINKPEKQKITSKQKLGVFAFAALFPAALSGCAPDKKTSDVDTSVAHNISAHSTKENNEDILKEKERVKKEMEADKIRIEEERVKMEQEKIEKERVKLEIEFLEKNKEDFKISIPSKELMGEIYNFNNLDKKTGTIVGNGKIAEKNKKPFFEHTFKDSPETLPNYTLMGVGLSVYRYSSPSRIENIDNAISKINGAILPPKQIFSFLKQLGTVSYDNGFVDGKVILSGKVANGLGGGVCQTSTTVFRALLNAGLGLKDFKEHSISYSEYYGEYGFDATVYSPAPDLNFVNDTENPIILKMLRQGNNVVVLVYGKEKKNVILKNISHSKSNGLVHNKWERQMLKEDGDIIRSGNFSTTQKTH